ncbi:MAG: Putative ATPase with chaperone activity [Desulfotomaculum sp. 46_80]|nr:MAG: Putative ATPase with chaperone activity [Desulfotomaculum sp. 46_80]
MPRFAVYCRVSSEEQAEKGTIESQVEYAKKYLDLYSPESGEVEYDFYLDEGVSGTLPLEERPAGARMLADAAAGKFEALFVYRLDRLARSVRHVLDTYELLEGLGIALKSMVEAFDTGTPTGKFFMTLLASIAALERDTILERTSLGKERSARQGKWVSGPPPFGYRTGADGRLEVFEPEARTVRLIFNLYGEMSTIGVAGYLNACGIPTPAVSKNRKTKGAGRWSAGHVSIILRNKIYAEDHVFLKLSGKDKEMFRVESPEIVDRKVYARTQQKLALNGSRAGGKKVRRYLLRGIVFCGNCGRVMVGSSAQSQKGRVYYRCTGVSNDGSGRKCGAKMVRADELENAVWEDIRNFVKNPGSIRGLLEAGLSANKDGPEPVRSEIQLLENLIANKRGLREKIVSLYARGVVTAQEAEKELKALADDIETLAARKAFLSSRQDMAGKTEPGVADVQALLENLGGRMDSMTGWERAEFVRGLVERIEVAAVKDGEKVFKSRIVVRYRFQEPV